MKDNVFFDSKKHVFALCLFAAIGPLVMMTTPVLAHQLSSEWRFSPSQVGTFFFYEQIFMGVAALPAIFWSKHYSLQKVMKFFIALFILGNFLSIFSDSLTTLVLTRLPAAFAAGSIMIVTMVASSLTTKPARTFALWLLGQTIFGAVAILILPHLFVQFGLNAFFAVLIALMLIATPFYKQLSDEIPPTSDSQKQHDPTHLSVGWYMVGVFAVLLFFMGISSVWTFLTSIGLNSKIPESSINGYLSLATLFGILGCFMATIISNKANRIMMLICGFVLFFISLLMLLNTIPDKTFMMSIMLFKFSWLFTVPFILASLSILDHSGAVMKYVSLMIAIGMGVGPSVSGLIIEHSANFNTLVVYTMMVFLASLILVVSLNTRFKKRADG